MSNAAVTIFGSKHSSIFRSPLRIKLQKFDAVDEIKWRSKFHPTFRGLVRFFTNGKTIAASKNQ